MTYIKAIPVLASKILALPIEDAANSSLFLIDNDVGNSDLKFVGALLLSESASSIDLIALMDVKELRRISRSLWDMANHLIEVRIEAEFAAAEKKKPKRKRKK